MIEPRHRKALSIRVTREPPNGRQFKLKPGIVRVLGWAKVAHNTGERLPGFASGSGGSPARQRDARK
jgi:hypothetical protein